VLKNRETNKELFVVNIELMPNDQAKAEGAADPQEKREEAQGQAAERAGADDDELD
jgi:hypothetical protein